MQLRLFPRFQWQEYSWTLHQNFQVVAFLKRTGPTRSVGCADGIQVVGSILSQATYLS